jgi:Tol biopolymer transport system component
VYQGRTPSGGSEIGNLYVLDVASGSVTQLTDLDEASTDPWWMAPAFSPDGDVVARRQLDRLHG